jgi:hypothetical protein
MDVKENKKSEQVNLSTGLGQAGGQVTPEADKFWIVVLGLEGKIEKNTESRKKKSGANYGFYIINWFEGL